MVNKGLQNLGEFGLIERLTQQVGAATHLVKGIGDDCAIQRQSNERELLTSTDLLIEGIHFDRRWISLEELGRKSVAVNISDIAAMGGQPKSLFLAVACPTELPLEELEAFSHGFIAEAERYGAVLAGGDTCRSPGPLLISVTVQGESEIGRAVCRNGAVPGDAIYVSGTLGDSALALQELMAGRQPEAYLLQRHNCPTARVELGRTLVERQLATAMLDVSDGIISDLGHILKASGVGATLELTSIPLSEPFRHALQQNPQLIDLALAGGEDYELLFTSAEHALSFSTSFGFDLAKIGVIEQRPGLRIIAEDGSCYDCQRCGFDHFS